TGAAPRSLGRPQGGRFRAARAADRPAPARSLAGRGAGRVPRCAADPWPGAATLPGGMPAPAHPDEPFRTTRGRPERLCLGGEPALTTATQLASAPSTPENLLTQPAALAAAPAPATASQDQASTRETPPFDEQLLMLLAPDHAEPQAGAADETVQLAGQPPADTPPAASSAGQTSEQNLEQAEALLGLFSAQQQQQVQAQVPAARPQASGAT